MGFGLDYAKNADKDKLRVNKKDLAEQETDDEVSPSTQASPPVPKKEAIAPASSSVSPPQTSSRPSRFARTPVQTRQPVQQINAQPEQTNKKIVDNQVSSTPVVEKISTKTKSKSPKLSYSGDEAERNTVSGPTPFQQKGMRARRLVQEVGEFKKWDAVALEQAERDAMRDPDAALAQYSSIYINEIKPFKINCMRSLEEALQKHPNEVVFMLTKKGGKKLCILPSEQAGPQGILKGATLESVPYSSTKFDRPCELFGSKETPNNDTISDKTIPSPLKP